MDLLTLADWKAVAAIPTEPDPLFDADVDARYCELRKQSRTKQNRRSDARPCTDTNCARCLEIQPYPQQYEERSGPGGRCYCARYGRRTSRSMRAFWLPSRPEDLQLRFFRVGQCCFVCFGHKRTVGPASLVRTYMKSTTKVAESSHSIG